MLDVKYLSYSLWILDSLYLTSTVGTSLALQLLQENGFSTTLGLDYWILLLVPMNVFLVCMIALESLGGHTVWRNCSAGAQYVSLSTLRQTY